MATLSTLPSICRATSNFTSISPISKLSFQFAGSKCKLGKVSRFPILRKKIRASVAEQEQQTLIPAAEVEEEAQSFAAEQPVSVPVSPSDILTMFFQAEGTMTETAIPTVAKALEEIEGISNLKVHVLEGIATVELTKQTTVQATGVASSLVETIQGSGFKLQTLNLSFDDEEDTE